MDTRLMIYETPTWWPFGRRREHKIMGENKNPGTPQREAGVEPGPPQFIPHITTL